MGKFLGFALALSLGLLEVSGLNLLPNRDFYIPDRSVSWRKLASELVKDHHLKQKTLFEYRKGTRSFEDICGIENPPSNKIVGGNEAAPNQFPWLVALFADRWFCSASLIADDWVLTAAHCVDGGENWRVYAGSHDISADIELHRVIVNTSEYYIHPGWNPLTVANDIALLKLPEKIQFNEFIRPGCLSHNELEDGDLSNKFVTSTGWGKLSDDSLTKADTLHYAPNLNVMKNTDCHKYYQIINDGSICIDSTGGHGVCNGDSGGPLNYQFLPGVYKTVGVASFVSSLGCESGMPHGFTRVSYYLDWIESVTGIRPM